MGIFDGLIGGVISGIGGVVQNSANADQAAMNRQFQEQMSNTAYSRGMADMKRAGLNPILAYQRGPASSPTGNTAVATNVGEAMVNGFGNSGKAVAEIGKTEQDTHTGKEEEKLKAAQQDLVAAQFANTNANTAKAVEEAKLAAANTRNVDVQTEGHSAENVSKKLDARRLDTNLGAGGAHIGRFIKELNPLAGAGVLLRGGR